MRVNPIKIVLSHALMIKSEEAMVFVGHLKLTSALKLRPRK